MSEVRINRVLRVVFGLSESFLLLGFSAALFLSMLPSGGHFYASLSLVFFCYMRAGPDPGHQHGGYFATSQRDQHQLIFGLHRRDLHGRRHGHGFALTACCFEKLFPEFDKCRRNSLADDHHHEHARSGIGHFVGTFY